MIDHGHSRRLAQNSEYVNPPRSDLGSKCNLRLIAPIELDNKIIISVMIRKYTWVNLNKGSIQSSIFLTTYLNRQKKLLFKNIMHSIHFLNNLNDLGSPAEYSAEFPVPSCCVVDNPSLVMTDLLPHTQLVPLSFCLLHHILLHRRPHVFEQQTNLGGQDYSKLQLKGIYSKYLQISSCTGTFFQ